MSRIGKMPVPVPKGVEVKMSGSHVAVKGPLGQLARDFERVTITHEGEELLVKPMSDSRTDGAMWGLGRSLLNNMVVGVSKGFERRLNINGVGYRADVQGTTVVFQLGYSHSIEFPFPEGITIEVDKQNNVTVKGIDKQVVGETAAQIRSLRPPEPYKGKGVKYAEEVIKRKAGKAAA